MNEKTQTSKQFAIQKLYVKDISFESPHAPESFNFSGWDPKIDLNLSNKHIRLDGDLCEAELCVTVTVNHEDKTAFLIEVHQAGLFLVQGFDDNERNYLIGSQCMTVLFPYVRELISDLSVRGGFPPLLMSPVNFDALYQQHLQHKRAQQDENQGANESESDNPDADADASANESETTH